MRCLVRPWLNLSTMVSSTDFRSPAIECQKITSSAASSPPSPQPADQNKSGTSATTAIQLIRTRDLRIGKGIGKACECTTPPRCGQDPDGTCAGCYTDLWGGLS